MNIDQSPDVSNKAGNDLRDIARSLGLKPHHKASDETVRKQIMQQPKTAIVSAVQSMEHIAENPVAPVITNTEDDVLKAIEKYTAAQYKDVIGFQVKFPDDGTWIFKCMGAEESGNLSIPLRIIKQKAEFVSKGRRILRGMGKDNTYPGSYTDNIIAG